MSCRHTKFLVTANVARILKDGNEPPRDFQMDIMVKCEECQTPFHFVGLPAGLSFDRPMVSMDGTELRAPIVEGEGPMQRRATFEMPKV